MTYRFNDISVDPKRRELHTAGRLISIQPQVFELLVYLIENRDRVVSKDEVIDAVWEGRIVSDGTLNARINSVRQAVGDSGDRQEIIKTFPRKGFRFVADVYALSGSDDDARAASAAQLQMAPLNTERSKPILPSIAVLPFKNFSNDEEQEFLADGITEDLITDLSKIQELFVVARHSSFSQKNSDQDISRIGELLGVENLLTGSLRRMGRNIRINAQLVEVASGRQNWAERFDCNIDELFTVQDEIAAQIIEALTARLESRKPAQRTTKSVEAYEYYLRGRSTFWFTPNSCAECIRLLDRAVELDPNYSDAFATQAPAYQSAWSFNWPGYDDGLKIALEKAEKALVLAPDSSFALSKLGWVLTNMREHEQALRRFRQALEIEPNNSDALAFFAEALNFAGDPRQAINVGKTAMQFDPIAAPNCMFHIGHSYFLVGELEQAREQIQRAIEMAPDFPVPRLIMAATLAELDDIEGAQQHIQALLQSHPEHTLKAFDARYAYSSDADRKRVIDGLRLAGLPE